jgi:predicted ribosome quality control (RQC) complex YloA/Tae2 family protein
MVFFFTCQTDPNVTIYMGKDKFENEDLIKYAYDHDIWFHVDNLSSAHVYLRTAEPITSYEEIKPETIQECAQLTKANSIEGCKKAFVGMNYTWARNLLKEDNMDCGQVSYKNSKLVVKFNISKDKDLIRATLKTRKEDHPNLEKLLWEYKKA